MCFRGSRVSVWVGCHPPSRPAARGGWGLFRGHVPRGARDAMNTPSFGPCFVPGVSQHTPLPTHEETAQLLIPCFPARRVPTPHPCAGAAPPPVLPLHLAIAACSVPDLARSLRRHPTGHWGGRSKTHTGAAIPAGDHAIRTLMAHLAPRLDEGARHAPRFVVPEPRPSRSHCLCSYVPPHGPRTAVRLL